MLACRWCCAEPASPAHGHMCGGGGEARGWGRCFLRPAAQCCCFWHSAAKARPVIRCCTARQTNNPGQEVVPSIPAGLTPPWHGTAQHRTVCNKKQHGTGGSTLSSGRSETKPSLAGSSTSLCTSRRRCCCHPPPPLLLRRARASLGLASSCRTRRTRSVGVARGREGCFVGVFVCLCLCGRVCVEEVRWVGGGGGGGAWAWPAAAAPAAPGLCGSRERCRGAWVGGWVGGGRIWRPGG